jgi:hypothetical protein
MATTLAGYLLETLDGVVVAIESSSTDFCMRIVFYTNAKCHSHERRFYGYKLKRDLSFFDKSGVVSISSRNVVLRQAGVCHCGHYILSCLVIIAPCYIP